jgi:2Fe-2S ferredoxin
VEVPTGTNILELAHDHHIEMESACGGVKACTTCHCIVRKGFDSLESRRAGRRHAGQGLGPGSAVAPGCQVVVATKT